MNPLHLLKAFLESNFLHRVHYYVVLTIYKQLAAKVGTELLRVLIVCHIALLALNIAATASHIGLILTTSAYAYGYLLITSEMNQYLRLSRFFDLLQHLCVAGSILCLTIGVL